MDGQRMPTVRTMTHRPEAAAAWLAAADRGRDLTPAEMAAAGATIRWYVVEAVQP